jgi:hypothetical protein
MICACGSSSSGPAPPSPATTAIVLEVTYTARSIDTLQIDGVANATQRRYGPFMVTGSAKVQSGATLGLVFDGGDAGSTMVCVQALQRGEVRATGCGMFAIEAGQTLSDRLALTTSSSNN